MQKIRKSKFRFFVIILIVLALFTASAVIVIGLNPDFRLLAKKNTALFFYYLLNLYDPFTSNKIVTAPQDSVLTGHKLKTVEKFLGQFENISILEIKNPILRRSRKAFYYASFNDSQSQELCKRYRLERFVTRPDFAGLVELRCWLKSILKHTSSPRYVMKYHNFDALKVLSLAEEGERFMCGEAAYVYVQCAVAIGSQARVVLLEDRNRAGHAVCEVWSNEYGKWIAMDIDYNIHYRKNGTPLSALELHNAYIKAESGEIEIIKGQPQPDLPDGSQEDFSVDQLEDKGLGKYYNFAVRMRNDFFRVYPRWHRKANTYVNILQWKDDFGAGRKDFAWQTSVASDLYWDLNSTCIYVESIKGSAGLIELGLFMDTLTPNFDYFLVQIDGKKGIFRSAKLLWRIHKGKNTIVVEAVNKWGILGKASSMVVNWRASG